MTDRLTETQEKIVTILWGILVVGACITLINGWMTRNLISIASAAIMAWVVTKTSHLVPIAQRYKDAGITEESFSGKITSKSYIFNAQEKTEPAESAQVEAEE